MNKVDPSVKWVTRIKILREPSKDQLQQEANTYIYDIESLGAKLVTTPKLIIKSVNIMPLLEIYENKIIYQYAQKYNKTIDSAHLKQKLLQYQQVIPPYIFYIQITYQVEEQVLKNNMNRFK